ncbi:hypothetical protein QBC34DRAFT_402731 [Podospora aff. communis PSN243]|uniref:Uncharacterized protein n=1 Tax=Podospora aff. communis PSN243 TaxID=3040156 RepID=A0AAV9GQD1_9PEZI|nr:hypothetical protein QBC34DRAFT_402731 [Podospora aff. communis PSN243]
MPRPRTRRRDRTQQTHLAGTILWLPSKDDVVVPTSLPPECHNHPVVVLSPRLVDKNVVILLLTSLGGTDLEEKFPTSPRRRRQYLPIHPANTHPDLSILLQIDDGQVLRKNSYVNLTNQATIPFDVLRSYEGNRPNVRYALTASSYQTLVETVGFAVPLQSPSHDMAAILPPAEPRPVLVSPREDHSGRLPALASRSRPASEAQALLSGFERHVGVMQTYGAISGTQHSPGYVSASSTRVAPPRPAARPGNRLPLPTPHTSRRNNDEHGVWVDIAGFGTQAIRGAAALFRWVWGW